jgi:hypothetical protein
MSNTTGTIVARPVDDAVAVCWFSGNGTNGVARRNPFAIASKATAAQCTFARIGRIDARKIMVAVSIAWTQYTSLNQVGNSCPQLPQ